jgi:hypothetical protein
VSSHGNNIKTINQTFDGKVVCSSSRTINTSAQIELEERPINKKTSGGEINHSNRIFAFDQVNGWF